MRSNETFPQHSAMHLYTEHTANARTYFGMHLAAKRNQTENWIAINRLEHSYRWTVEHTQKCRWFSNSDAHLFDIVAQGMAEKNDANNESKKKMVHDAKKEPICNRTPFFLLSLHTWLTLPSSVNLNKMTMSTIVTQPNYAIQNNKTRFAVCSLNIKISSRNARVVGVE